MAGNFGKLDEKHIAAQERFCVPSSASKRIAGIILTLKKLGMVFVLYPDCRGFVFINNTTGLGAMKAAMAALSTSYGASSATV